MADDGWVSVPRGKKSRKPQPVAGAPAPSRDLSVEDIARDFNVKTTQWKQTECRKRLIKQVEWALQSNESAPTIERYISIGGGSLSRDNVECRRRSMWQIVVFLDLVAYLLDRYQLDRAAFGSDTEDGVRATQGIWVSDPAYTKLDVAFLLTQGVDVAPVDNTGTGLGNVRWYLRDGALLYEPFVDMNAGMIKDMMETDVSLYIGSSIGGLKERQGEVAELAKTFCAGKFVRKFPAFEIDPNIFDGMEIYWKDELHD